MSLPPLFRGWTWQTGDDPRGLELRDLPLPSPAAGRALVRNAAIGLNPVDWKVLGGTGLGWRPGHVPGVDGAGMVVAVGAGVTAFHPGQRVAYHQNLRCSGSFAEYTEVDVRALMRLPDALSFEQAAAFPCPGLTAWTAIEKLPVKPGRRILISGAGGGVGNYLTQLAVGRGFVVTALCHSRHWQRLRDLGVAETIETPPGPEEAAAFFAVIDSVSADHAQALAPALAANGHLVCIQGRVGQWPCPPFGRSLSLHEVALGALHQHGDAGDWERLTAAGEGMLDALSLGHLTPEALVVGDFQVLPDFLFALRHRRFSGKSLIRLS